MHPDSFNTAQPFKALFNAGTVAINAADGYPGWTQYILDNASTPTSSSVSCPSTPATGAELANWTYGSGVYSITTLKKQNDPEKLKLILRVLNWLAAPFGTEEYFYRWYGQEGVDHTIKQRQPGVHQDRHGQHGAPDPLSRRRAVHDLPARPSAGRRHPAQVPVAGDPDRDSEPDHRPLLEHVRDQERHHRQQLPQRVVRHHPGTQAVLQSRRPHHHLAQPGRGRDAQRVRGAAAGAGTR